MEIKNAEIIRLGEKETFKNDFYLVKWVVKTDEQYPQILELESIKEKADDLLKYNKVGDKVDVSINLRGREWTNPQGEVKVFNKIEAWKVFKADKSEDMQKAAEMVDKVFEPAGELSDSKDDLPF